MYIFEFDTGQSFPNKIVIILISKSHFIHRELFITLTEVMRIHFKMSYFNL